MTHLLQPNDSCYNKKLKQLVTERHANVCAMRGKFMLVDLLDAIHSALNTPDIVAAIKSSYKHTGLVPFDASKASSLLGAENPSASNREERLAVNMVTSVLQPLIQRYEQAKKPRQSTKPKRKSFFSTNYGELLTGASPASRLLLNLAQTELRLLSADKLHAALCSPPYNYCTETLMDGNKFLSMEKLYEMVFSDLTAKIPLAEKNMASHLREGHECAPTLVQLLAESPDDANTTAVVTDSVPPNPEASPGMEDVERVEKRKKSAISGADGRPRTRRHA